MLKHIRPHKLFNLVPSSKRQTQVWLPGQYSPIMLETVILLALVKLVDPKIIFEFGTYLGMQTYNFAANIKEGGKVYTIDLDEESFKNTRMDSKDILLAKRHFQMQSNLAFLGTPVEGKIHCLYGDSKKYNFHQFHGEVGFVYVDGGHDAQTVESDSKNAFNMLPGEGFSCIAWHDYLNREHPEVTKFLDNLSRIHQLYHVEESKICFYLQNASADLLEELG